MTVDWLPGGEEKGLPSQKNQNTSCKTQTAESAKINTSVLLIRINFTTKSKGKDALLSFNFSILPEDSKRP